MTPYQINFSDSRIIALSFLFLIIYVVRIYLAKILTQSRLSLTELMLKFAFSLIPIALVYNIAHYYTLLLTQRQEIISLILDSFGAGQNLFNAVNYQVNLEIIDANII